MGLKQHCDRPARSPPCHRQAEPHHWPRGRAWLSWVQGGAWALKGGQGGPRSLTVATIPSSATNRGSDKCSCYNFRAAGPGMRLGPDMHEGPQGKQVPTPAGRPLVRPHPEPAWAGSRSTSKLEALETRGCSCLVAGLVSLSAERLPLTGGA